MTTTRRNQRHAPALCRASTRRRDASPAALAQRPGLDGRDKPGHDAENVVQAPLADAKPSAALADQVKSLDWRARKAKKKGAATKAELAQALAKARALFGA